MNVNELKTAMVVVKRSSIYMKLILYRIKNIFNFLEYYDQQFYIFRILVNLSSVVPFTKKKQQPKQKIYLEV
ncbi:hypothetical protein T4A_8508 [Trichinella pseudospiralis]|uniref:Uncharacterized protein n=1 Tax=Trichinella pseudospiralis TaxID=6337 RepID=A0A0V1EYB1_TRIPS|nr:hypothetical protein T4A_8508 [Trichinella pseudospiralis]